jgi:hypothetical protein
MKTVKNGDWFREINSHDDEYRLVRFGAHKLSLINMNADYPNRWNDLPDDFKVDDTNAVTSKELGIILDTNQFDHWEIKTSKNGRWKGLKTYLGISEIIVPLNAEYEAVVNNDGVKVGCQTFSFNRIEAVMAAITQVKKTS